MSEIIINNKLAKAQGDLNTFKIALPSGKFNPRTDPIVMAVDELGRTVRALRSQTTTTCTRSIPPVCTVLLKPGAKPAILPPRSNNSLSRRNNERIVISGRVIETALNQRLGQQFSVARPSESIQRSVNIVDEFINTANKKLMPRIAGRTETLEQKTLDITARDKIPIAGTIPIPLAAQPKTSPNSTARFGSTLQPTVRQRTQGAKTKTNKNQQGRFAAEVSTRAGTLAATGALPATCANAAIDNTISNTLFYSITGAVTIATLFATFFIIKSVYKRV